MAVTFTVEDGTGLSTSNAYVSVAFVDQYLEDRGRNLTWKTLRLSAKQAAIIRASDYMDLRWTMRGQRLLTTQNMEAPRRDAYYDNGSAISGIVTDLEEAAAEYAELEGAGTTLAPNPSYDSTGNLLNESEIEVGSSKGKVVTKKVFSNGGTPITFRNYPTADAKMCRIVASGGVSR